MAKALIFLLFFIIFLILKVIFWSGKKIVKIGAEAFDTINGTHFSDYFKENLPLENSIVILLVIGAYEDGKINLYQKKLITELMIDIINNIFSGVDNRVIKNSVEKDICKTWKEIGDIYKTSSYINCFFENKTDIINKAICSINENQEIFKSNFNKIMIFLIKSLTINTNNKYCKKEYLYLIGKNLGFNQNEIDLKIKLINPNFFDDEEKYKNSYKEQNNEEKYKKDPYEILGVSKNDTFETIKNKYKQLVKKFHPDFIEGKGLDEEFIKFANERLKEINWAFDKIKKEKKL